MWFRRKPTSPSRDELIYNANKNIADLEAILAKAPARFAKRIAGVLEAWKHYRSALECEHTLLSLPSGKPVICIKCGWEP
jgi:hypothetical protein